MPIVPFETLPPSSRIWIFASDRPLDGDAADRLLSEVDDFLERWQAHGEPLRVARQWRDAHFIVVGVDSTTTNASGCSIDGLFRKLQRLQDELGVRLIGGGRVFYRDPAGAPRMASRDEFALLARGGEVTRETPIFDTSLTTLDAWRAGFERPAGEAWTRELFGA